MMLSGMAAQSENATTRRSMVVAVGQSVDHGSGEIWRRRNRGAR
jgi:hypothetical protein